MGMLDDFSSILKTLGLADDKGAVNWSNVLGGGGALLQALGAIQQGAPEEAAKQQISGATTGTSAGTSNVSSTGAMTQNQTQNQQQTGATTQTAETTLPQWYLDLVKQQANAVADIKPMEAFGKTMLDMPVDQYMNPYLEQVADPIMRRLAEDQALQQQKLAASSVSRGAFGSGRSDLLQNQLMERQATEKANALGTLYSQAFGNAQGVAGTDLTRMYDEWKTMQNDPKVLAQTQAGVLSTLKPGQISTTSGTSASNLFGTNATTGTTAQTQSGTTTGATTGTTAQQGYGVKTGTEPNDLINLGTIFQGLGKAGTGAAGTTVTGG